MSQRIRDNLGPSIIIAAAVVGTGELVVAPSLGAKVGISALWIIILGCLVKVLLQEQIGRHTILTGQTTLEAFNEVPGPKWRLSWVSWSWLLLLVSTAFQQAGILATTVQSLKLLHIPGHPVLIAGFIAFVTAAILIAGRYGFIEKTSGILVAGFTFMTVTAVVLLQWTEHKLTFDQIAQGFTFDMPAGGFAAAITVFGITGIGTSELLFYPYWCLEKGYASDIKPGQVRDAELVRRRILGMRLDIVIAMVIYTFSTIAFFLLGATILHKLEVIPGGLDLVKTLSNMYTGVFGSWVFYVFAIGAFFVLYSTFFVGVATFARIFADNLRLATPAGKPFDLRKTTCIAMGVLATVYFVIGVIFQSTPQWLIIYGGAVQTLMLPIFGAGVLWISHKRQDAYRTGWLFNTVVYLSFIIITIAAGFSAWALITGVK